MKTLRADLIELNLRAEQLPAEVRDFGVLVARVLAKIVGLLSAMQWTR